MIKVISPAGKILGDHWDYKGCTEIVQIFICHDKRINHFQFQYAVNKSLVLSAGHGRCTGFNFTTVELDYPREYLVRVRGTNCIDHGDLSSITFVTNLRTHGPFGNSSENDTKFCYNLGSKRQFGGFHGTADDYAVRSIGIYVKPISTLEALKKTKRTA